MRISIVMPTLNQASFIDSSLESIFSQQYPHLEVLVIDGQSTDGTLDILLEWQNKFPNQLKWISAKDSGPAEAINRGLRAASGEIIGWLNSDDLYCANTLSTVAQYFKRNKKKNAVYGQGSHIDEHGSILEDYPTLPPKTDIHRFQDGSFICQPTMFIRKSILQQVGLLDSTLKLAFDFDWWLSFFKIIPGEIGFIDESLALSRLHKNCLTKKHRKTVAFEGMKVISKHLGEAPITWVMTYIDELCELYPFIDDDKSLVQLVESFLNDVKSFLNPDALKTLIASLREDKRLSISGANLFAAISPDGWVSKESIIKLRLQPSNLAKYLEIGLMGGWPEDRDIALSISTSFGVNLNTKMNTKRPSVIRLDIPTALNEAFVIWRIKTEDYFIPSDFDSNNDDHRQLSFMINSLKLVE